MSENIKWYTYTVRCKSCGGKDEFTFCDEKDMLFVKFLEKIDKKFQGGVLLCECTTCEEWTVQELIKVNKR